VDKVSYEFEKPQVDNPKCLVITFSGLLTEQEIRDIGTGAGWEIIYSKKQVIVSNEIKLIIIEKKGATLEQQNKVEELCKRTGIKYIKLNKLAEYPLRFILKANKPQ
jgi:hypothetical protein